MYRHHRRSQLFVFKRNFHKVLPEGTFRIISHPTQHYLPRPSPSLLFLIFVTVGRCRCYSWLCELFIILYFHLILEWNSKCSVSSFEVRFSIVVSLNFLLLFYHRHQLQTRIALLEQTKADPRAVRLTPTDRQTDTPKHRHTDTPRLFGLQRFQSVSSCCPRLTDWSLEFKSILIWSLVRQLNWTRQHFYGHVL